MQAYFQVLCKPTFSEIDLYLFTCLSLPSELTPPVYSSLRISVFTSHSQQPTQVLTAENDLMKAIFGTNITTFQPLS